ncbi:hypothetical protein NKG05_20900 [Oerskovia sp. M15]
MRIAVVALGKIGLPLAVQFADRGHDVVGIDVNPALVDAVNSARVPFPGGAPRGEARRGGARGTAARNDRLRGRDPGADAVVVVVPLFVDEETAQPDFGWMDAATRSLAAHLTPARSSRTRRPCLSA